MASLALGACCSLAAYGSTTLATSGAWRATVEVADASQLALWAAYENGKLLQHPSIRLHASFYVSAQTVQWQNHFLGVGASGGEAYSQLDRAGVVESTLWHGMED